ncbi:TetR/AcrR family transcriptional regulator [Streptomyces sp. E5N91]|uniref:TetR/AcrR family transcriptional regulator n=1 Tax=Streptomyces sp. E5N91 TaxID=1851996 RepID=UPI001930FC8B|nr:TetR/AcrR family transcriptional regulator [Streptomyces sp. E5N91]
MTKAMADRPLRSDAVRSRKLLRKAAAEAFAEEGTNVSIAHIAERAGIAKGTVFRHYATKEDLVAAIVCQSIDALVETGERLEGITDAGKALRDFMTEVIEVQARDRAFCEVATGIAHDQPAIRAGTERLHAIADALTDRARRQGAIRADITGQDVMLLVSGIYQTAAPLRSSHPQLWRRYLSLTFDGMQATDAAELPSSDADH